MSDLRDHVAEFRERGVLVYGVSLDAERLAPQVLRLAHAALSRCSPTSTGQD
jgi:hypothetical protein